MLVIQQINLVPTKFMGFKMADGMDTPAQGLLSSTQLSNMNDILHEELSLSENTYVPRGKINTGGPLSSTIQDI